MTVKQVEAKQYFTDVVSKAGNITIKELPEDMRPRERLWQHGAELLTNSELLAILLRTGIAGQSALDVANRILAGNGGNGLHFLLEASASELATIPGLGMAKAAQIKAAVELGRRITSLAPENRPAIRSPEDVSRLLMEEMRHFDREHFRALALNTKNAVLAIENISVGSLASSIVHPRELFKALIRRSAAAVILVHNHPSGDPTPSKEDREVTKRLVEAGKLLGIEVLDHIIIGNRKYISLKEQGWI